MTLLPPPPVWNRMDQPMPNFADPRGDSTQQFTSNAHAYGHHHYHAYQYVHAQHGWLPDYRYHAPSPHYGSPQHHAMHYQPPSDMTPMHHLVQHHQAIIRAGFYAMLMVTIRIFN